MPIIYLVYLSKMVLYSILLGDVFRGVTLASLTTIVLILSWIYEEVRRK